MLLLIACAGPSLDGHSDSALHSGSEVQVESIGDAPEAALRMSPPGQVFTDPIEVTLSFEGAEVEIYYTLDGSPPNERDELYEGPIVLEASAMVRAVAVGPADDPVGPFVAQNYVHASPEVASFDSNLPLIVLASEERLPDEKRDNHTRFGMLVLEPSDTGRTPLVGEGTVDHRLGLKVRGSSSAGFPKHSYGVELWGAGEDEDDDVELLGMPAESDWVLLSPLVFDRAFMRNALAYQLSRDLGRYAPRTAFVEVFAAGSGESLGAGDYRGVYVLVERVKRSSERVDIARLDPEDADEPAITGGYLFKEDRAATGEYGFYAGTAGGTFTFQQPFIYVDPSEDEITTRQAQYLAGELDELGWALAAEDFTNPQTGRHYRDIVDVDAFIDHHILNTFPKNPDAFRLSGYLHKDREQRLVAGPLWDFDRTMGCAGGDSRPADPTWWDPTNQTTDTTYFFRHGFWLGFFRDPAFVQAWSARFAEVLDGPMALDAILAWVDAWELQLQEPAVRNFQRWPDYGPRGGNYASEVQLLREWITARHGWISGCLERADPLSCTGG